MNPTSSDEWLERAFRLGYFLHGDRHTAVQIAAGALNKVQVAATAQSKRLYYRLTGRADARKVRSKVTLKEPHLLQRLVYAESENHERRKEQASLSAEPETGIRPARQADLVVFFVKHLVRITTKRNSFYVTLGLSRLLYNYTTPETMELYNLVIQDPDRVHDEYYYRSRKGILLKELKERFGELLEITRGVRGEQRFSASKDGQRHHELVTECLRWFTPWSTPCVVPERFDPFSETIEKLTFEDRLPDEEHEVEVNRIHAALHPECFARLAAANRLAAPDQRLELPHFFLSAREDDAAGPPRNPSQLSEAEFDTINGLLAQEASRRKAASASFLRVLVDGTLLAEIHAEQPAVAEFEVDEEAELIEVYSADQSGALLLATHLLNLDGANTQHVVITVEGGQRVAFTINVLRDGDGSTIGAAVAVVFRETAPARVVSAATRRLWNSVVGAAGNLAPRASGWWKPLAALTVLALLCGGAWWAWTNRQIQPNFVRTTPTPAPALIPVPAPTVPGPVQPKGMEQQLVQQQPVNRATQKENGVSPPPVVAQAEDSPPNRDEAFVERSLLLNSSENLEPSEVATRGAWNRDLMGKPLEEVRRVHVQVVAETAARDELLSQLRNRLEGNSRVQLSDAEQADAALKISMRPASARADESRVVVIVRAANASGYVVWPASRRGSSWRYVGRARYVAERLVRDLTRDIESARRRLK